MFLVYKIESFFPNCFFYCKTVRQEIVFPIIFQVLTGNTDEDTIIEHFLSPPIRGKFIRICPRSWHDHISLRMELYGCPPEPSENSYFQFTIVMFVYRMCREKELKIHTKLIQRNFYSLSINLLKTFYSL